MSFDSGQLGFNYNNYGGLVKAPAADRDTWKTPKALEPGTYNYFCRIHPFMRGSFRVAEANSCHGKKATHIGTSGPDVFRGTPKRDVIIGLGGNDTLIGLGGNDFLCGGSGKDKLVGGKGKDRMWGGPAKDRLLGGAGKDNLNGGAGKDRVKQGRL